MKQGYLSDYFDAVGRKTLRLVDTLVGSNQHEVGDSDKDEALKAVLGKVARKRPNQFDALYVRLLSDEDSIRCSGKLSWYDTRAKKRDRSAEWRLYYQTNPVTELMAEGDTLFVARQPDDKVLFIVVPKESSLLTQLSWLFGLTQPLESEIFSIRQIHQSSENDQLNFLSRFILEELGIEFEDPESSRIDSIVEPFGLKLPKTKEFSALARETLPEVDARTDPDEALIAWIDHEERMFRRLEKRIVANRLVQGFLNDDEEPDVDAFIKFSLSVQNTRKSRMGLSFEHHVGALLNSHNIRYATQAITERRNKPDFLFPGQAEYDSAEFRTDLLTLLAAKSTCKERWRQISSEADRIERKHLITTEPGVSEAQTTQMDAQHVQLVVPRSIHQTYNLAQQDWLWSVSDFIELVRTRQQQAET